MLMYLARHGRQNAADLENMPMPTLIAWVDRLHEMMQEEQQAAEEARKR